MNETKAKAKKLDRIVLQPEAAERVGSWAEALNDRFRGLRLTRSDLVNHLILSRASVLTEEEQGKIRERYFDEVSFAAWVLKELKTSKEKGERLSMEQLLSGIMSKRRVVKRRRLSSPAGSTGGAVSPEGGEAV